MDVHIRRAVTSALRLRSIDVLTAQEDGAAELDDDRLLERATELGRVLVSQDEDLLREGARRLRNIRRSPGSSTLTSFGSQSARWWKILSWSQQQHPRRSGLARSNTCHSDNEGSIVQILQPARVRYGSATILKKGVFVIRPGARAGYLRDPILLGRVFPSRIGTYFQQ